MNCFAHQKTPAIGLCAACQKAICGDCVGRESPRLVCKACEAANATLGFEYKSSATLGGWPLVHMCAGIDG